MLRTTAPDPFTVLLLAALAGCAVRPPVSQPAALEAAQFADLPGWAQDSSSELIEGLRLQCHRLALLPADTALGGDGAARAYAGEAGQWADACAASRSLQPGQDAHAFFQSWFQPYRITTPALVTGYYEPDLRGSMQKSAAFPTPALARPADLVQGGPPDALGRPGLGRRVNGQVVPYWARAEIEAGYMGAEARPLLYLASPIDLMIAQIQGSARVHLTDGSTVRLLFDGRNGRPFTPLGHVLVQMNALAPKDVSMQTIRAWLIAHPDQAKSVMDRNESYVFFRLTPDTDPALGPPGALGVALTPGRSAAVDRRFLPLGAPVFVDSTVPDGRPWRHLVLAQDLGSAIDGPGRIDVFLGEGDAAEDWAGRMHQPGRLWVLLPRQGGKPGS